MARAIQKYLSRYAEPEVEAAARIDGDYARALVVPACAEEATLRQGFEAAFRSASGRTLCIIVVNGRVDAEEAVFAKNDALLRELVGGGRGRPFRFSDEPPMWLVPDDGATYVIIDRASPGYRLPARQGVGLARKIGVDVALALHANGRLGKTIFWSDADARLPADHFERIGTERAAATWSFPFWHEPSGDEAVDDATAAYEVSLRYYVLGLSWAGCPYAAYTIGSALAIDAGVYAAVRGVPKLRAGEDFYLVNKAAKVGPVHHPGGEPVLLRSRRSRRTPFGTGRAVDALLGRELLLYDPRCFEALKLWLPLLSRFADHRSTARLRSDVAKLPEPSASVLLAFLDSRDAFAAFASLSRTIPQRAPLAFALSTWFDGFKTLKLIHALRSGPYPSLPWRRALSRAPFYDGSQEDIAAARASLVDWDARWRAARLGSATLLG